MLKNVFSTTVFLFLVLCLMAMNGLAQPDACSPTKPNPQISMVNIPEAGTPKTPAGGVADGWVLLYKDADFQQLEREVYCQGNKILFASSVGKKNYNAKPNCAEAACTKAVANEKTSKVTLKGKSGNTNQFEWRTNDFAVNGFTVLYTFAGSGAGDGANPRSALIQDASANLYGTTYNGGNLNDGTVFELGTGGTETVLHSFVGSDGKFPVAGLVQDSSGNFYGATTQGGAGSRSPGAVYELKTDGTLTVLHSFSSAGNPESGLLLDSSGNLYGTSVKSGAIGDGQVYMWNGTAFTTLYSFTGANAYPVDFGTLAMDSSGNLYGTTSGVGGIGYGSVFELSSGTLTVLYSFAGGTADGCYPDGSVAMDSSGNLYGTTTLCGTSNAGTVWELSPNGSGDYNEAVLYDFTGGVDGSTPDAGVVLDSAGNLYGVTISGGDSNGDGVLYEVSPSGTETVLHAFSPATDGSTPIGGVLVGADGNLYGTASAGGSNGFGTVWGYNLYDTLNVTLAGTGTGTVTSSPTGINCPGTCSALFTPSTVVSLTETPGTSATFGGWSGACSGSGSCQVTLNSTANVTATFSAPTIQPTTTAVSSSLNPSQYGQTVILTVTVTPQTSGTPTGSVTFYDGASMIGAQALSGGAAQLSASSFTAGAHSITVIYSGDTNYQASTSSPLVETVNQAATTIVWSTPSAITYGTALSSAQLNASATPYAGGTYDYTPAAGTVLNAGSQTLSVTFTPSNTNYAPSTGSVTLQVNPASTSVVWSNPASITYGTALSATQLNATVTPAGATGSFVYTPGAGTVLNAGSQMLSVAFNPSGANYASSNGSVTLQVNQASQTITFTVPPPQTATNKSSFTVAATASSSLPVSYGSSGSCTNNGATFTITSVTGTCTVTASQAGNTNYLTAPSVTVTTTVTRAIVPTVSFTGAPASASYQDTFTVVATTNASTVPTITATGACTISGTTVTMSSGTGTCFLKAAWAADDVYTAAAATQRTTAEKLVSNVTWTTPAAITYGTALSVAQLDATASVPGVFVYNPTNGKVLGAGTQTLSVKFVPTAASDYTTVTATTVSLLVNQADTTTTITSASLNPSTVGHSILVHFDVASPGEATGSVTVTASSGETCTGSVIASTGNGRCSIKLETAGSITLTAIYNGDANNTGSTSAGFMQTVNN